MTLPEIISYHTATKLLPFHVRRMQHYFQQLRQVTENTQAKL